MATLTIRKLDDELREKLRVLAAENGRSMEEEARASLRSWVEQNKSKRKPSETGGDWARAFRKKLAKIGYIDFEAPKRERPKDVSDLFS